MIPGLYPVAARAGVIHFVYPFDESRFAAPWSIGNHVAAGLRASGYAVKQYDWMDRWSIFPGLGDVLLGHPHTEGGYVFRNSISCHWRKRIALAPWNGDAATGPYAMTRMLPALRGGLDLFLGICGPYWAARPPQGVAFRAVDMAADVACFPAQPRRSAPTGHRRYLYAGCTVPDKGTALLEQIIALMPGARWGHVGYGQVAGCHEFGYVPVESPAWREIVDQFDFVVSPGLADANPTVLLEGALCGLIPICTRTSGWDCWPLISSDPVVAAAELLRWQWEELEEHQRKCRAIAESYTWGRFTRPVLEAVA